MALLVGDRGSPGCECLVLDPRLLSAPGIADHLLVDARTTVLSRGAASRVHLLRSPHNGEATIMLASVLASRGDELGAARVLDTVPFWWPKKREMLLLEGQLFLAKDRAKTRRPRGRSAYVTILSTRPHHPRASSRKQPWDCSRFFSSRARGRGERAGVACLRTGRTTRARGNPAFLDAARTARRRARHPRRSLAPLPRDRSPRLASARALAEAETSLGHTQTALSLVDECLRSRPDDLLPRRTLLDILLREGDTRRHAVEVARIETRTDVSWEVWTHRRGRRATRRSRGRRGRLPSRDRPQRGDRGKLLSPRAYRGKTRAVGTSEGEPRESVPRDGGAGGVGARSRNTRTQVVEPRSPPPRRDAIGQLVSACRVG